MAPSLGGNQATCVSELADGCQVVDMASIFVTVPVSLYKLCGYYLIIGLHVNSSSLKMNRIILEVRLDCALSLSFSDLEFLFW